MRPRIGTTLLAMFGLVLLVVPPHVTGLVFFFFLFLYEYGKQAERGDPEGCAESDEDEIVRPGDAGNGRPDFHSMFDDPGFVKEQEELR